MPIAIDTTQLLLIVIALGALAIVLQLIFGLRQKVAIDPQVTVRLEAMDSFVRSQLREAREDARRVERENQESAIAALDRFAQQMTGSFKLLGESQNAQFESFKAAVKTLGEFQRERFGAFENKEEELRKLTFERLVEIRTEVQKELVKLREDNAKRLDEMRKTVDEKLQESIGKRFDESFKLISDRLEQVHKGLGEMQTLASDVGGLKSVLTQVKTRGAFGEIQLGAILAQTLSPEQYAEQMIVKEGTTERVDFALKLPGKGDDGEPVWLPIDSKFPIEDYQRLNDAYEANESRETIELLRKQFDTAVRTLAKSIAAKYINPPKTTDFAIMFVPTEGLYAEILRRAGTLESLQREHKITVVGPTNLIAFLSSLQMGFRTLAIEKRSSEVWTLLGGVKTEFGRFGETLDRVKNQLATVGNTIEAAGVRTRAIERKLRDVEALPTATNESLIEE
ncbi:DNA recombination protein RmuC [Campylobacterota bacterium]|nr:DNA recombination protein RmuC [Campylobacterota bacterium]